MFSANYLDWVKIGAKRVERCSIENFTFDKMIFHGSVKGQRDEFSSRKVYEGGTRKTITARAILSIAKGVPIRQSIDTHVNFHYHKKNGILEIWEGNHRLLGFKLYGSLDFIDLAIEEWQMKCFEEENFDLRLNSALLFWEGFFPKLKVSNIATALDAEKFVKSSNYTQSNPAFAESIKRKYLNRESEDIVKDITACFNCGV
jgi:hypothetical protein